MDYIQKDAPMPLAATNNYDPETDDVVFLAQTSSNLNKTCTQVPQINKIFHKRPITSNNKQVPEVIELDSDQEDLHSYSKQETKSQLESKPSSIQRPTLKKVPVIKIVKSIKQNPIQSASKNIQNTEKEMLPKIHYFLMDLRQIMKFNINGDDDRAGGGGGGSCVVGGPATAASGRTAAAAAAGGVGHQHLQPKIIPTIAVVTTGPLKTSNSSSSSLPKFHIHHQSHVIDPKSSSSLSKQSDNFNLNAILMQQKLRTATNNNNNSNNQNHSHVNHWDSVDKWPSPLNRNSSSSPETASSPYCSSNSESSSGVSTCSSDHETNNDDGTTLSSPDHVSDHQPDSPDSGLSDSVNNDDKLGEDLDDFYQRILYGKTDRDFVHNDLDDDHWNRIDAKHKNEHSNHLSNDIDVANEQPILNDKPTSSSNSHSTIHHSSHLTTTNVIDQHIVNKDKEIKTNHSSELESIERRAESVLQNLHKGFDCLLETLRCDLDHNKNEDQQERDDQVDLNEPSSSSFNFGFDFPMENSMNNLKPDTSFDWSIKSQAASDMQTMIKQMKMNAQNIKMMNSGKKPQIFYCQWLDCDWPGNYEDLAEHLREIHVELQPFLDANGKVIKWNKQKVKSHLKNDDESTNDDFDSVSQTTMDDLYSDEDECLSEDDNESSRYSIAKSTRRSKRLQGAFEQHLTVKHDASHMKNGGEKSEKFVCLWVGCKVFGKPSLSRHWIERHVLEQHSGPKPFKCIVDGCGQRFRTQVQLEKHVNMHFKTSANSNQHHSSSIDLKQLSVMNNKIHSLNIGTAVVGANESCCKCHCHSSSFISNCDNSNSSSGGGDSIHVEPMITNKHRTDKTNRSQSVDSGISLQSICSSIDVQTSTQSLSTLNLDQQQSIQHCHTICCCLNNNHKSSVLSSSSLSLTSSEGKSSKVSKNNKKKLSSTSNAMTLPFRNNLSNLAKNAYINSELSLKLLYEVRARDALLANVPEYCPYETMTYIGKKSPHTSSNNPTLVKEIESRRLFKEQLFNARQNLNVPLKNDMVACKARSDDEFFYTKRCHPLGILNDKNIHEAKLEYNKKKNGYLRFKYPCLPANVQKSSFDVIFNRTFDDYLTTKLSTLYKRSQRPSSRFISRFQMINSNGKIDEDSDDNNDDDYENKSRQYLCYESNEDNEEEDDEAAVDNEVEMVSLTENENFDDEIELTKITIAENKRKVNDQDQQQKSSPKRRRLS